MVYMKWLAGLGVLGAWLCTVVEAQGTRNVLFRLERDLQELPWMPRIGADLFLRIPKLTSLLPMPDDTDEDQMMPPMTGTHKLQRKKRFGKRSRANNGGGKGTGRQRQSGERKPTRTRGTVNWKGDRGQGTWRVPTIDEVLRNEIRDIRLLQNSLMSLLDSSS